MASPGRNPETDSDGIPIIYHRAIELYDYMQNRVNNNLYDDSYQMYEGKITEEVAKDLGMTPSQYSRAMKLLKDVHAVERVERSFDGSSWVLYYRPDASDFSVLKAEKNQRRRKPNKFDQVEQRVNDLILLTANLENRLSQLERKLEHGED